MENEMIINGKEYVLKEEAKKKEHKTFNRYELKIETLLHKSLKKLIIEERDCISEDEAVESDCAVMDPANVCMIYAKSERAKLILRRYLHEESRQKRPKLNYRGEHKLGCKFSTEYLKKIFDFLEVCEKDSEFVSPKILSRRDFPMSIYNKDFVFILAPRVENDESYDDDSELGEEVKEEQEKGEIKDDK